MPGRTRSGRGLRLSREREFSPRSIDHLTDSLFSSLARSSPLSSFPVRPVLRSAGIALKTWAPASVSVWHKKVVEQTPVSVDSRMEDLAAKLKVTKLMLKSVLQRMETKKRKLSVLEESLSSLKREKI